MTRTPRQDAGFLFGLICGFFSIIVVIYILKPTQGWGGIGDGFVLAYSIFFAFTSGLIAAFCYQEPTVETDLTRLAEKINWFDIGDHEVLPIILDAATNSDASVSQMLGGFLYERSLKHSELIFHVISTRPLNEQVLFGVLAAKWCASCSDLKDAAIMKETLTRLVRQTGTPVAGVAELWLTEFSTLQNQLSDQPSA